MSCSFATCHEPVMVWAAVLHEILSPTPPVMWKATDFDEPERCVHSLLLFS